MLPDDPEDLDRGLAQERTRLAWERTAIAFGAVGVAVLRRELLVGLIVLAATPLIWAAGLVAGRSGPPEHRSRQLLLVTVTITVVGALALAAALLGHGPASLRDLLPRHG